MELTIITLGYGLPVALALGLVYWSVLVADVKPAKEFNYIAPERQVYEADFTRILE